MPDDEKKTALRITRLAGVAAASALALALVTTATALAEPEFKPTGGTFTGSGLGADTFAFGGSTISCTTNTAKGTISSATLAGGVIVTFTGCKSTGSSGSNCTIKSVGAAEGTLATNTLHGVLGLILPKGMGTGVGLLLLPVANKKFWTLAANTCTVETTMTGNIAGEVSPVGKSQTTGKLAFVASSSGGGESVKDFDLSSGGLVRPELELFGALGSVTATEDVTFSAAVEVT
jgi:hypothetical protein